MIAKVEPRVHPVDAMPQAGSWLVLSLQHVLTMYAGAITVPLLIGAALRLSSADTAFLVSADLFACGLVTLLQTIGVGRTGIRLPVVMGVTFASVMPAIAIASNPALGLPGVYGAAIVAGGVVFLAAPLTSRLALFLTPVVTSTAMLLIGMSLIGVAVDWAAGGRGAADYGSPHHLLLAAFTIATILLITRFGRGFLANCAVLAGMVAGYIVAAALGYIDFSEVERAPVVALVTPFHFGMPRFDLVAIASMLVVLLVCLVESSGMFKTLGTLVDRPVSRDDLARGMRADGLGAVIGAVFNSFPYTSYAQNIALVGMTGVRSRFVCAGAGALLILLALLPKMAVLIAAIPPGVLGGSGLVLFGMVAASGIRSLADADLAHSKGNLIIVSLSLAIGMIPTSSTRFFAAFPPSLSPLLQSGVLIGVITAILLNILFNGLGGGAASARDEPLPVREGEQSPGDYEPEPGRVITLAMPG